MILRNGVKWNLKKDYKCNILKKLIHKSINYKKIEIFNKKITNLIKIKKVY